MTVLEKVISESPRLLPNTKRAYLGAVQSFLNHASREPSRWTGPAVETWRDRLRSEGRRPQTVNLYLRGLRYASRRVAERARNPALDFAGYAEKLREDDEVKTVSPLTVEQGRALVAACAGRHPRDLRDTAIVVLMLRTGLRRDGVCRLQLDDLTVGIPMPRTGQLRVQLKGKKRHVILIDDETLYALGPWLAWLQQQGAHSGAMFRAFRGRPGIDGTIHLRARLSGDGLLKSLGHRAEAAGIRKFHPHRLRHTCISWLRAANVPDWRIAQLTGHTITWKASGPQAPMLDNYTKDLSGEAISSRLPPLR